MASLPAIYGLFRSFDFRIQFQEQREQKYPHCLFIFFSIFSSLSFPFKCLNMSSTTSASHRHRRSSSTPALSTPHHATPSLLSVATGFLSHEQRRKNRRSKSTQRESQGPKYTYSFRRSEHFDRWQSPPAYESVAGPAESPISYSLSFSRRRSRSSSFLVTPLRLTQPWTEPPNSTGRARSSSTPVSPVISPWSTADSITSTIYRSTHELGSPQRACERSPAIDLPSPFSSPLFYWSGQSNQEPSMAERLSQSQADDLALMSPFGAPAFYWDGVSRQESQEGSTLDRAKRTWEKLGRQMFGSARHVQSTLQQQSRDRGPMWDERRQAYILHG